VDEMTRPISWAELWPANRAIRAGATIFFMTILCEKTMAQVYVSAIGPRRPLGKSAVITW
jgi:hypothetical protein